MKIVQQRIPEWSTAISTISELYVDEVFECHILEDKDRFLEVNGAKAKVPGQTAIPRGKRNVIRDKSNRFGYVTPRLLDVEYFTWIRCHKGNDAEDTEGCLLPGYYTDGVPDWVSDSRKAFEKLDLKIETALAKGENVTWEIV